MTSANRGETALPTAATRKPDVPGPSLVRRGVIGAITIGLAYSVLSNASRGYCFGEGTGNGVTGAPSCLQLDLHPAGWVYLMIAVVVIVALRRARRPGTPDDRARRILSIGLRIALIAMTVILVLGYLVIFTFPMNAWRPGDDLVFWWPLNIDVQYYASGAAPF